MSLATKENVLSIKHWNDKLFSIKTTRDKSLRFSNGQFVMMGIEVDGKPLLRAYSLASANYEEHLEFFSIKVPDGRLTSRLQFLQEGHTVLVSKKPVGTLMIDDLRPGKNLYLFATGTGLAPFLSIIKDPETYQKFEHVVLVHCVRRVVDLAYREWIDQVLPVDEYIGESVRKKLIYYPTVTREEFKHTGRITTLIKSGKLFSDLKLPRLDPSFDRIMICGCQSLLNDLSVLLDSEGFEISPGIGQQGDYVIERAFADQSLLVSVKATGK